VLTADQKFVFTLCVTLLSLGGGLQSLHAS